MREDMDKLLTSRRPGEDRESLLEGLESVAEELRDSYYPPQRTSTFPVLDSPEAQDRFLCSPTAVLESLGLRIPAALAEHLKRSSVPPPPHAEMADAVPAGTSKEDTVSQVNTRASEVSPSRVVRAAEPASATSAPAKSSRRRRNAKKKPPQ